jgi:mannose/fructose/N-acetylgalactosamine-specific phosphotransferase system component IID
MIDLGVERGEIASENRLVVQAFLLAVLIGLTDAVSEDHELQKRAIEGIKMAMRGQLVKTS